MRKQPFTVLLAACIISQPHILAADLITDVIIMSGSLKTHIVCPEPPAHPDVRLTDGLSVSGNVNVAGKGIFPGGVAFLAPFGDVPMGSFTNALGNPAPPGVPAWWSERGVVDAEAGANDFAAAVQAQVKWIALQAAAELDARLAAAGGAGTAVSNMVASFSPTNNFHAVTLGQLKNTAKPFHDRLMEIGLATNCPWAGQPADFAPANIGQVKHLFAFDLARDTDGDGLPDWWEAVHGLDRDDPADVGLDPDGDGLTNLQEHQLGTGPLNPDTDGDGMPDGWEVANGLGPLADDAALDSDNDGLTNLQEHHFGAEPLNPDTDGDGMPDGWEVANGLCPLADDAVLDSDNDGLTNLQEHQLGADPQVSDT
ncbi:MAG: hypothetical protein PHU80_06610, partial [Kiritimatiellae bacterium]|nr:hypothetical protein [Kiritimatiellia bacterium]